LLKVTEEACVGMLFFPAESKVVLAAKVCLLAAWFWSKAVLLGMLAWAKRATLLEIESVILFSLSLLVGDELLQSLFMASIYSVCPLENLRQN